MKGFLDASIDLARSRWQEKKNKIKKHTVFIRVVKKIKFPSSVNRSVELWHGRDSVCISTCPLYSQNIYYIDIWNINIYYCRCPEKTKIPTVIICWILIRKQTDLIYNTYLTIYVPNDRWHFTGYISYLRFGDLCWITENTFTITTTFMYDKRKITTIASVFNKMKSIKYYTNIRRTVFPPRRHGAFIYFVEVLIMI